ncbi:gamma-glutamyl hydrolase [Trichonephila inaurata madagascariensis]|uniref:folate gamma-glutamyl hydrolase n=1 Tax=Trichonephila inaurata madagascariensis TaxID=2747483 RepID=A0A8X7BSJ3_9ARAC|nr:gamma-glutamyl hydrolase [Trichonephila inaurata madagascariensis]
MYLRASLFFTFFLFLGVNGFNALNDRPIIGVVTEEINSTIVPEAKSYLLASYVKFLELAGARVVPIWIHEPRSYYEDIMNNINGVLFPGGGNLLGGSGYSRTGQIIFDIANKMNDKGDFFPLWGSCLGFELLHYLVAQKLWMKACAAQDIATNLEFVKGYEDSKMFRNLEPSLDNAMKNENVAIHYHRWCFTPQNYTLSGLNKYFKVLALNRDSRNMSFVSIVEAYKYPYYGVSFHPEKVLFEWILSKTHQHIPYNLDAIRVSQYFANFFVNEARKSFHKFPSKQVEDAVLIYNYNPVFTGQFGTNPNTQSYYFMQ